MARINVPIPDELKQRVDAQAARWGFNDAGEYVLSLIESDLEQYEDSALERQLVEGLRSGRATPMTDRDWAQIRREIARRSSKRTRKAS
jgi:antitoxin ParD1/3/4